MLVSLIVIFTVLLLDLFLASDISICSPVAFSIMDFRSFLSQFPLLAISLKEVALFHHTVFIIIVLIELKLLSVDFLFSPNDSPLKTMENALYFI